MSEALRLAAILEDEKMHSMAIDTEAAAELRRLHAENETLKAELAEQARVNGMGGEREARLMAAWENKYGMKEWQVHAIQAGWMPAPTPRKPLTDEEIVRLMVGEDRVQLLYAKPGDPGFSEFSEGAIRELVESGRAIERAHGITGEQT